MEVDAVDPPSWNPPNLTVNGGDTVTFKNASSQQHTVRCDTPGPADVDIMGTNSTATVKMSTVAVQTTFKYHCGMHPSMKAMPCGPTSICSRTYHLLALGCVGIHIHHAS
jgi:plastocyanin